MLKDLAGSAGIKPMVADDVISDIDAARCMECWLMSRWWRSVMVETYTNKQRIEARQWQRYRGISQDQAKEKGAYYLAVVGNQHALKPSRASIAASRPP